MRGDRGGGGAVNGSASSGFNIGGERRRLQMSLEVFMKRPVIDDAEPWQVACDWSSLPPRGGPQWWINGLIGTLLHFASKAVAAEMNTGTW